MAAEPGRGLLGSILAGLRVVTPYLGFGVESSSEGIGVGAESGTPPSDPTTRRLAKEKASVAEGLEQDLSNAFDDEATTRLQGSTQGIGASEGSVRAGGT